MLHPPQRMVVLEIGGRRSRLVVSAAAFIAGVFLLQLLMFRVNPHHQRGPYFEPNGPSSIRIQASRPEAPDPLTQLLWCNRADTLGRLWLWQLLTLGFAHSPSSLWPLLVGLLGLWLFGPALEQGLGLASTLGIWFAASAAAGLTTCAVSPDAPTLSCLASALALAGAFLVRYPRGVMFLGPFPVPTASLAWLFSMLAVIAVALSLDDSFRAAYWPHLMGFPVGMAWVAATPRVKWRLLAWSVRREQRSRRRQARLRVQVDELLDKVSRQGVENLTWRERRFLRKASRTFKRWRNEELSSETGEKPHA